MVQERGKVVWGIPEISATLYAWLNGLKKGYFKKYQLKFCIRLLFSKFQCLWGQAATRFLVIRTKVYFILAKTIN